LYHCIKNKYFHLLASIACFLLAYFLHKPLSTSSEGILSSVENTLHQKEKRLEEEIDKLSKISNVLSYSQILERYGSHYYSLMNEEGLALLIYENDTLKFWSDNSIAVENWMKEVCLDTKMVKLRNGWFEVVKPKINISPTKNIVGLILLKYEYPYQNKYLVNEFHSDFSIPSHTKLVVDQNNLLYPIKSSDNEFLFSLDFSNADDSTSFWDVVAFALMLLSIILFVAFLKNFSILLFPVLGKNFSILLFCIITVGLRYISIKNFFPSVFYSFDLFGPTIYANSDSVWLSSLGDLLINVSLLFYISYFITQHIELNVFIPKLKKINKIILSFLLMLLLYWFSFIITTMFIGIIKNSNIPFTINNIFSLNHYTYIALFIIGLLLFAFFILCNKMVSILKLLELNSIQYVILFVVSALIHATIAHLIGTLDLVVIFWPFATMLAIALIKKKNSTFSFSSVVFMVFIFSMFAVHIFSKHTRIKENDIRKVYAERLSAEQDPVAELLFQEVKANIQKDTALFSFVNRVEKQPAAFEKYLKQEYFSGFWEKYDVHVALFDSMCSPLITSANSMFDNNLYFDELIEKKGNTTSCENFSFINNSNGKITYIGKLMLPKNGFTKMNLGSLYIELDAKFVSDEIGFPELLLDKNVSLSEELSNYSYAKYKSNQLISHYGKFPFSITGKEFPNINEPFVEYDNEGYNHIIYSPNKESKTVISKPIDSLIEKITRFSYLFAYFSLLLLIILFIRQISKGELFRDFSFKYRIQVLLVFIVLTSLALFGGGTIFYIKTQFENKNKENISEKIHSIQIDLESKLAEEKSLNQVLASYYSFVLKKFSSIFFTDINLYDLHGNLFASSRPKVFDEGLTSKKMNPEAYLQIAVLGKTEFIHDEQIGKLEYLSVYIPFKNKNGELLAYLNLPYFAKQSELEKEISGFMIALINIYVLLFALSIVFAILISNYVTRPLKLIQDKLSKIKLGKTNEQIEWKEKDEIGSLVSEYNRMIIELSNSAQMLAKSERESAWREMAKQVAHEIKNPLTPMKLSVQYLQRTWNDKAEDMDEKIARITQTIIEQIDTLSTIATEFSNFAKMPKANFEETDLIHCINNSIYLYNKLENIVFEFNHNGFESAIVMADKEQLLRIFNNLFKNAIQSIDENKTGIIKVNINKKENYYLMSVSDNGSGIPDAIIDKIFTPNFTTKNAGMGLGLAMVKSIVESCGGKIWFETEIEKGTTFFVEWPLYKNS